MGSSECCSETVELTSIYNLEKSYDKKKPNYLESEPKEHNEVILKTSPVCGSALMTGKCLSGTPDYIPASAYCNPLEMRNEHFSVCQSPMANQRQHCNHIDHCHHHNFNDTDLLTKDQSFSKESGCFICKAGHLQLKPLKEGSYMTDCFSLLRDGIRMTVKLDRGEFGFGIRIIGGIEEGSQVGCDGSVSIVFKFSYRHLRS